MKLATAIKKFVHIVNHPGSYIQSELERVKSNTRQKIADLIVKVIIFALMGLVGLMILIFGSVTLGLWLNDLLDSSFLGFLLVTGFYIFLMGILLLIKDKDKITYSLFGFAKKAVLIELESPRYFEHQPENGFAQNNYPSSSIRQHQ
jgi:hypothetical protein